MDIYKGVLNSSFEEVHLVVLKILELLRTKGNITDRELLFNINFMLREILNNAVEHGNKYDEEKKIICEVSLIDNVLVFEVEDEGEGIDLEANPFNADKNYVLRERNRGIKVIMDLNFKISVNANRIKLELEI